MSDIEGPVIRVDSYLVCFEKNIYGRGHVFNEHSEYIGNVRGSLNMFNGELSALIKELESTYNFNKKMEALICS